MATHELDILKPIDASISNSDDYEIFTLSNAQVLLESNGKPASLLIAYADTPLRVEGRLEPPSRGQLKYLCKKPFKPLDIEIRNVTRFSYGQTQDGEIVIWALGQAGWFELRPARHYKAIFDDMIQAVEILYFVTDIYNEPRKRGGGPSAQLIFQEYAEDERFTCTDPAEAAQIFDKHHIFLLICFLNRAQGLGWSNTPIYQYFRRKHPDSFDASKARVEGRYVQSKTTSKASKVSAAPAPAASRASREKQQVPKPIDTPKKDENWWEAATLFEFMQKAVNQRVLRAGQGHITSERVARLVVKRYEIDELETARNVLLVHARNLCYMMDHPRRKTSRYFAQEPIYRELLAGHTLPAAEVRRTEGIELRPRRDHGTLRRNGQSDESDLTSDDEIIVTPKGRLPHKKTGRLSIIRPRSGKFSGKGKGVKGGKGKGNNKMPTLADSSADEMQLGTGESDSEGGSEMAIDTPTQALSPSGTKRKLIATDTDDTADNGRRKRAASEAATPESPPSTEEDEDTQPAPGEPPLPLRYRPTNTAKSQGLTKPPLALPLVSTPLPTFEANGPRDSWICTFDGCSQKIYGASKNIGRQLIEEHMEDHAKGRQNVVGIVLREEEKLRLPVNNLLKRIREMTEQQSSLFPASRSSSLGPPAVVQPRPIERSV
ncbi:hypothetical protein BDV95DRAFT_617250 [Massariosphaeria phaeospora]|uniref:DNA (cytosine-5)-methyltransferase 1 replication foci domain-containing protein n=1 Tax=Massariosphaeria phaeospora TaxID=100035 RepID=A0A7C8I8R5_9PLEO|nr:hypothetical protein BDV95DRAFT_617250 [Massariosphaeria phaeospora]